MGAGRTIPNGRDFDSSDFGGMDGFGFSGSAKAAPKTPAHAPVAMPAARNPVRTSPSNIGRSNDVQEMPDGSRIEHHPMGGHTVHRPDGSMEIHHPGGGSKVMAPEDWEGGGGEMTAMARGGKVHPDLMQDKKLIKRAFGMHDEQEHPGKHTNLGKLRNGGMVAPMPKGMPKAPMAMRPRPMEAIGAKKQMPYQDDSGDASMGVNPPGQSGAMTAGQPGNDPNGYARGGRITARIPRGMRPKQAINHSPINTPTSDPQTIVTPRNFKSAGQMAYGVEPSSEPQIAGSEQGIPQLKGGGRVMTKKRGGY